MIDNRLSYDSIRDSKVPIAFIHNRIQRVRHHNN